MQITPVVMCYGLFVCVFTGHVPTPCLLCIKSFYVAKVAEMDEDPISSKRISNKASVCNFVVLIRNALKSFPCS